jgi:hypothetical protein
VKIGHGPATVIGHAAESGKAESQDAFQARHTLALFARKSAAIRLALLARLFYFGEMNWSDFGSAFGSGQHPWRLWR